MLLDKKRPKYTLEQAEQITNEELENSRHNPDVIRFITKNHLIKYLQKTYNVVYMPDYFYIKLDEVFNGTYKNMSRGVPPQDLLDMWIRKQAYLNQKRDWNKSRGNPIDGLHLIQYDLAILLSKYGSYLQWKEEQRIAQEKNKIIEKQIEIDIKKLNKIVDNNLKEDQARNKDIADFLEEI